MCFRLNKMELLVTCPECSKSFKNKNNLKVHKFSVHTETWFTCKECDKAFKKKDQLKTHLRIHEGPKEKCSECGISFVQKKDLTLHFKNIHLSSNFKCKNCDKCFITKAALKKHLIDCESLISSRESFSCDQCKKVFHGRQTFDEHKCMSFLQEFLESSNISVALEDEVIVEKATSSLQQEYPCIDCETKFLSKKG